MQEFDRLLSFSGKAFKQTRSAVRARQLAYGALTCLGRHTLTGMLTASGRQFVDWSTAYKLFGQGGIDVAGMFQVARQALLQELTSDQMMIAHMDDTLLRKTGKKVAGCAWRRDPLGPPFHTNFIWGQRFLQISMALPQHVGICQSRAIPVDFHHCPGVKKPKKGSAEQDWSEYKEKQKLARLSTQGSQRIQLLRERLDQQGARDKQLFMSVDGSYTNEAVIKTLPRNVTLIGRIRKDTKLYHLPDQQPGVGRKRVYGERLPTPEQIRQSDQYPWQQVEGWAAGKIHLFDVKVIKPVRWRSAGEHHDLQLIIIRPLGYRLTKKSRVLYRDPAYLICTDPNLDIQGLLQAYLWRWEIEVNFRDEKTLLGCGQAQVRKPLSAASVPAFIVAIYAFLHLAAHRAFKNEESLVLPKPLWHTAKKQQRLSSCETINLLRTQMWAKAIGSNFSGFVQHHNQLKSRRNTSDPLISTFMYMRK
jgi:hypothetical protein